MSITGSAEEVEVGRGMEEEEGGGRVVIASVVSVFLNNRVSSLLSNLGAVGIGAGLNGSSVYVEEG